MMVYGSRGEVRIMLFVVQQILLATAVFAVSASDDERGSKAAEEGT
jgi:hypothetical protein